MRTRRFGISREWLVEKIREEVYHYNVDVMEKKRSFKVQPLMENNTPKTKAALKRWYAGLGR